MEVKSKYDMQVGTTKMSFYSITIGNSHKIRLQ